MHILPPKRPDLLAIRLLELGSTGRESTGVFQALVEGKGLYPFKFEFAPKAANDESVLFP